MSDISGFGASPLPDSAAAAGGDDETSTVCQSESGSQGTIDGVESMFDDASLASQDSAHQEALLVEELEYRLLIEEAENHRREGVILQQSGEILELKHALEQTQNDLRRAAEYAHAADTKLAQHHQESEQREFQAAFFQEELARARQEIAQLRAAAGQPIASSPSDMHMYHMRQSDNDLPSGQFDSEEKPLDKAEKTFGPKTFGPKRSGEDITPDEIMVAVKKGPAGTESTSSPSGIVTKVRSETVEKADHKSHIGLTDEQISHDAIGSKIHVSASSPSPTISRSSLPRPPSTGQSLHHRRPRLQVLAGDDAFSDSDEDEMDPATLSFDDGGGSDIDSDVMDDAGFERYVRQRGRHRPQSGSVPRPAPAAMAFTPRPTAEEMIEASKNKAAATGLGAAGGEPTLKQLEQKLTEIQRYALATGLGARTLKHIEQDLTELQRYANRTQQAEPAQRMVKKTDAPKRASMPLSSSHAIEMPLPIGPVDSTFIAQHAPLAALGPHPTTGEVMSIVLTKMQNRTDQMKDGSQSRLATVPGGRSYRLTSLSDLRRAVLLCPPTDREVDSTVAQSTRNRGRLPRTNLPQVTEENDSLISYRQLLREFRAERELQLQWIDDVQHARPGERDAETVAKATPVTVSINIQREFEDEKKCTRVIADVQLGAASSTATAASSSAHAAGRQSRSSQSDSFGHDDLVLLWPRNENVGLGDPVNAHWGDAPFAFWGLVQSTDANQGPSDGASVESSHATAAATAVTTASKADQPSFRLHLCFNSTSNALHHLRRGAHWMMCRVQSTGELHHAYFDLRLAYAQQAPNQVSAPRAPCPPSPPVKRSTGPTDFPPPFGQFLCKLLSRQLGEDRNSSKSFPSIEPGYQLSMSERLIDEFCAGVKSRIAESTKNTATPPRLFGPSELTSGITAIPDKTKVNGAITSIVADVHLPSHSGRLAHNDIVLLWQQEAGVHDLSRALFGLLQSTDVKQRPGAGATADSPHAAAAAATSAKVDQPAFELQIFFEELWNNVVHSPLIRFTNRNSRWWMCRVRNLSAIYRHLFALASCARMPLGLQIMHPWSKRATPPSSDAMVLAGLSKPAAERLLPVLPPTIAARFNDAQRRSIATALTNTSGFTLIQGRSGTGKTRTIIGLANMLYLQHQSELSLRDQSSSDRSAGINQTSYIALDQPPPRVPRFRLLICAPSDAAVDDLTDRLEGALLDKAGEKLALNIVRLESDESKATLSRAANKSSDSAHMSFHARVSLEQLVDERIAERRAANARAAGGSISKAAQTQAHHVILSSSTSKPLTLRDHFKVDFLTHAHIVCTTIDGAGHDFLREARLSFPTIIIDDSTEVPEIQTLTALQHRATRCILVGNSKQFKTAPSSQSLFQRLQNSDPGAVQLLTLQYRLHWEIARRPSQTFYEDRLKTAPKPCAALHAVLQSSDAEAGTRHDIYAAMDDKEMGPGASYSSNPADAEVAVQLFAFLRRAWETNNRETVARDPRAFIRSIGVISAYSYHVPALYRAFARLLTPDELPHLEIGSADSFQGRENEFILFSTLRYGGELPWDQDWLNVALTRAIEVLARTDTREQDDTWWHLLQDAKQCERIIATTREGRIIDATTHTERNSEEIEADSSAQLDVAQIAASSSVAVASLSNSVSDSANVAESDRDGLDIVRHFGGLSLAPQEDVLSQLDSASPVMVEHADAMPDGEEKL